MIKRLSLALLATLLCLSASRDPVKDIIKEAEKLSTPDLQRLVVELRKVVAKRLLTPSEEVLAQWEGLLSNQSFKVARLLNRGKWEGVLPNQGGGAYWSFVDEVHNYQSHPDIELSHWKLSSGFHGGCAGAVIYAGDISQVPPDLLDKFAKDEMPESFREARPQELRQFERREFEKTGDDKTVAEGDWYIVRSAHYEDYDVIAAVIVLQRDEDGITMAWKILEELPKPHRR